MTSHPPSTQTPRVIDAVEEKFSILNSQFSIVETESYGFKPSTKSLRSETEWPSGGRAEFRIRRSLFVLITLLFILLPTVAPAKLAVFVDGRVLKVADARLDGSSIVLDLSGGGTLRVPAVRIDRVVADEVEDVRGNPLGDPECAYTWAPGESLPTDLPFRDSIVAAARAADLHPWLVAAVAQTESAFDPLAVSRVGAAGLMQLMPSAAADRGVDDVFDPSQNLIGGAQHLRLMLDRFKSLSVALAAYNAGASTVDRYQGIPPYKETRQYVRTVLELFCPEE